MSHAVAQGQAREIVGVAPVQHADGKAARQVLECGQYRLTLGMCVTGRGTPSCAMHHTSTHPSPPHHTHTHAGKRETERGLGIGEAEGVARVAAIYTFCAKLNVGFMNGWRVAE